jgi:hypothetical protein
LGKKGGDVDHGQLVRICEPVKAWCFLEETHKIIDIEEGDAIPDSELIDVANELFVTLGFE